MYQGKIIHPSHHLGWQRGVLYCLLCGCYTYKRVYELSKTCRMKPANLSMKVKLTGIKAGICPLSGKVWPEPHGTNIPYEINGAINRDEENYEP